MDLKNVYPFDLPPKTGYKMRKEKKKSEYLWRLTLKMNFGIILNSENGKKKANNNKV